MRPDRGMPAAAFVTNKYALAAFELGALDYLLKAEERGWRSVRSFAA